MTAAFFMTLREGLEAALIVGIIGAYLVKTGRRDALPRIVLGRGRRRRSPSRSSSASRRGHGRALAARRPGAAFEGLAALVAVVVLTWMLFWMRRQGRAMKGELERGVDRALDDGSAIALAVLAFVASSAKGIETSLFLVGHGGVEPRPTRSRSLLGALAGLAIAVVHRRRRSSGLASGRPATFFRSTGDRARLRRGRAVEPRRPRVRRGRRHHGRDGRRSSTSARSCRTSRGRRSGRSSRGLFGYRSTPDPSSTSSSGWPTS